MVRKKVRLRLLERQAMMRKKIMLKVMTKPPKQQPIHQLSESLADLALDSSNQQDAFTDKVSISCPSQAYRSIFQEHSSNFLQFSSILNVVFLYLDQQYMKLHQLKRFSLEEDISQPDESLSHTMRTLPLRLQEQIKDKYKTFTKFNYRQAYQESKTAKRRKKEQTKVQQTTAIINNFIMSTLNNAESNEKDKKLSVVTQEMAGIKSQRRERFKKSSNTYQIIKHYIEKEGFKPTDEELYLMKSLTQLREFSEQNHLDSILKKIYRFMNEAVDFNQLRFLCLLILLAADICYQFKDYKRAFYFYNQSRLFSSYSSLHSLKTEALFNMAQVAAELKFHKQAIIFFKKSLQYAWKVKDLETQLLIYDYIGTALYYQGEVKESRYYHHRFTQGEYEHSESAIKKISAEMLLDYDNHLMSLEKKNLTSLFLQYINLPIVGLDAIAPPPKTRIYENYDQEGFSPRRKKKPKTFEIQDFPETAAQIEKIIAQDYQFKTEIPNPDVQPLFVPTQKYGRYRKSMVFQQSSQYHKIVGFDPQKVDMTQFHSSSFQKRIQQVLTQKKNPDWWMDMKDKIRKNQLQKVGQLRERIRNSHQSYGKYPDERRRAFSLKGEKIKQSFNKTLLEWIDPK